MSDSKEEIYEAALTESQMECDALKAHNKRLRGVVRLFIETYMPGRGSGVNSISMPDEIVTGLLVLSEATEESLNHIKAQVEEETIDRCAEFLRGCGKIEIAAAMKEHLTRKYKEQSDED